MRRAAFAFTFSLTFSLLTLSSHAAAQEMRDYTVAEGDTCGSIARRVYGNSRRYDRIHEHNPALGPMPHRLAPGTVLRLPVVDASDANATVTAARRQVRSQAPRQARWDAARVGTDLYQGWRVSTGERSSAELTFRSSSVAAIRAETLVIVYGGEAREVRTESAHAVVRAGSMLSRLSALSGDAPLEVETPTARATLDEGESTVSVEQDGTTRVASHSGRAARVRNHGSSPGEGESVEVRVPPGMGTKVARGAQPSRPRPLPRAPAWPPDQPSRYLALSDRGGTLRGAWQPVEGARTYRVEVARRPDGRDLVAATEVPASVTQLELHRLPPGDYYVRVATIDDDLFEGRPAEPVVMHLVGVTIVEPGAAPPPPLDPQAGLLAQLDGLGEVDFTEAAPARVPVLQASRLLAPEGVTCAVGASAPSAALTFETLGEQHLTCVDTAGANIVGMDVDVVAARATLLGDDGGEAPALARDGIERFVRVTIEPSFVSTDGLSVVAPAGVTVSSVEPHPSGGLRARLAIAEDAPASVELRVVRGEAELATVQASTADVARAPVEAPRSPGAAVVTRVPEALGLAGFPSAVGLRDERRHGSGIWMSLAVASARTGEPDPRVRGALGVRGSFLEERLRVDVMAPLEVIGTATRRADQGSRDVFAAVSSLILDGEEGLGLALEAGVWLPTGQLGDGELVEPGQTQLGGRSLGSTRLSVAGDLSWRTHDGVLILRTRQAGLFDLVEDESLLWASAYGIDLRLLDPLTLGIEGSVVMGTEDLRTWYGGAASFTVGLDVEPVFVSAALRLGFPEADDLFPTATFVANVRGSFSP